MCLFRCIRKKKAQHATKLQIISELKESLKFSGLQLTYHVIGAPLTSPFSSWTISTLRSVSLGSSSLKLSSFFQRGGIFPSHVYIWDFCTPRRNGENQYIKTFNHMLFKKVTTLHRNIKKQNMSGNRKNITVCNDAYRIGPANSF